MYVNLNEHKSKFTDVPDPDRVGIVTNLASAIKWCEVFTHTSSVQQVFVSTTYMFRNFVKPHLVH